MLIYGLVIFLVALIGYFLVPKSFLIPMVPYLVVFSPFIFLGGLLVIYYKLFIVKSSPIKVNSEFYNYLLQIHISTLLVFTFSASGLLYLNFLPRPGPGKQGATVFAVETYGWPAACFVKADPKRTFSTALIEQDAPDYHRLGWDRQMLAFDVGLGIFLLLGASFCWECWLSLRDKAPEDEELIEEGTEAVSPDAKAASVVVEGASDRPTTSSDPT